MKLTYIFILVFSFLIGCSSSENEFHKYEPDYLGRFVNSEEKLPGWYKIPDNYYHKNDSIQYSVFSGGYYLADKNNDFNLNDTNGFKINVFYDKDVTLKQERYRTIVDRESKFTNGMMVEIINSKNDTLVISGQDGSMYMIQEAIDPNGNWSPIEFWHSSFCGNSSVFIYFPPHTSIKVGAFRYTGSFKTKLRFKFKYFTQKPYHGEYLKKTIYSQPFDGSVNYSQFHKKSGPFINYLE